MNVTDLVGRVRRLEESQEHPTKVSKVASGIKSFLRLTTLGKGVKRKELYIPNRRVW